MNKFEFLDKRATAAQLLEDPFLGPDRSKPRSRHGPSSTTVNLSDFSRSYSVPADRIVSKTSSVQQQSSSACNTPTSPDFE